MTGEQKGAPTPQADAGSQKSASPAKCLSCGATSATRPLVNLLHQEEPRWVCVRCLPILIHGG